MIDSSHDYPSPTGAGQYFVSRLAGKISFGAGQYFVSRLAGKIKLGTDQYFVSRLAGEMRHLHSY